MDRDGRRWVHTVRRSLTLAVEMMQQYIRGHRIPPARRPAPRRAHALEACAPLIYSPRADPANYTVPASRRFAEVALPLNRAPAVKTPGKRRSSGKTDATG